MGTYTAQQIANLISAQALLPHPQSVIKELITDTRKIHNAPQSIFFALTGVRNGHHYADDAYRAGVRNFVISEPLSNFKNLSNANIFRVDNTLAALQALAAYHRGQYPIPVVGITGSNGKTIVKEWLYQLLRTEYNIVRSPKSYNSQIGVPLSVWQMDEAHNLGIFEAGISTVHEMYPLKKIIAPTVGVFTNLGDAHNEGFADKKEKGQEKANLFNECEKLVYCEDNYWVLEAVDELLLQNPQLKTIAWSQKNPQCALFATIEKRKSETNINIIANGKNNSFVIPFTDNGSIENALHCAVVLFALGKDINNYKQRFLELSPVEMRLQLKNGVRNCIIINDAYNADLNSLSIALDFLAAQKQHSNTALILSDIMQSGMQSSQLYSKVAQWVNEKHINFFIGIGSEISNYSSLFAHNSVFFEDTKEFLSQYNFSALSNTTILVKGARNFRFEKIIRRLEEKTHDTVLEINLTALGQNLAYHRKLLPVGGKIMAMVKAYSYGSGSYETANALQFYGADYLAVAYADEGIELRKKGISLPIMVMNPTANQFAEMLEFYLEPEIYSIEILESFIIAVNESAFEEASIHLEFDTGMHRLGFDEAQVTQLLQLLQSNPQLKVASVFSHLSASDDFLHDDFTRQQIARFESIKQQLQPHLPPTTLYHICNSAAITRFPQAHYSMVRLGIGLYGIDASLAHQKNLQPAFRLKTTLSQIRHIAAHDSVGYARMGQAGSERKIAVAAIGYADGFRRELSNGKGQLKINGQWAPVVGNVCMDMCMVDITAIECQEGDEAIVFENNEEIISLAKTLNTIPYEVLTSINQRVKRVYWQE